MDANILARFLISGISLLGIAFTLLFLVSDYRLDDYRERLFELREELFDLATKSDVGFGHPAYRMMNLRIKSLLLYAHRTKLIMFLTYALFSRWFDKSERETIDVSEKSQRRTLEGLGRDQERLITLLSNRVDEILIWRVFFLPIPHIPTEDLRAKQTVVLRNRRPFMVKAVENQAMKVYDFGKLA